MHHENYTTNFTLLAVQLLILPKLNNEYTYIYTHIYSNAKVLQHCWK